MLLGNGLTFYADQRAVEQTLINLLSNALEFSPHHGAIEVLARASCRGQLVINSRDHGNSISGEELLRLGLPLGLSLSRELVEPDGGPLTKVLA